MKDRISSELFLDYLKCPYKVYLKSTGKLGTISDFQKLEVKLKKDYANYAYRILSKSYPTEQISISPKYLIYALKNNYKLIIKAHATIDHLSAYFDAIILSKEKHTSKCHPILLVYNENIHKHDRLLLALSGLALTKITNRQAGYGRIIRGKTFTSTRVYIDKLIPSVEQILSEIVRIFDGKTSPKMRLNDHCQVCAFNHYCHKIAISNDDLSLLKGLSHKEITKLNKKGIFNINQLSYTFRPRRQRKKKRKQPLLFNPSLQALAIREDKIYVAQKPDLPDKVPIIYLDIEGIPERKFYYLIGLHIDHGEYQGNYSFWANNQHEEKDIWDLFLKTLNKIDYFTVAHYGSYDRRALISMQKKYGGNKLLIERILSSCVNVLLMIYGQIYFPTYSNDLKSLASCLDFNWSVKNPSGLRSIIWRYRWEITRKNKYKKKLLKYNHEDCLALRHLMGAIYTICEPDLFPESNIQKDTAEIPDLVHGWPHIFKRNEFFSNAFDRINKCSYFDYQRERVYVRTNPSIRRNLKREASKFKKHVKINRLVECSRPKKCPRCQSTKIWIHQPISKTINDLKLFDGGIKRWVVKYISNRYRCPLCNKTFQTKNYRSTTYGHTLRSWVIYQNIALLRSHKNIIEEMRELFRYGYLWNIASNFKSQAATFYKQTYSQLFEKIRKSPLIHADETKVSIKGVRGYVWAFTNLEEVVYLYTDTREGAILDKVLDGFEGVLISDFYAAYDSQPCPQQKCLIHLIRDINDDLFKNPFDEDLKKLSHEFTELLLPMIKTIDKYGLKKRHLNKHQKPVDRFQKKIANNEYSSAVAKGYQKRFDRYKDKLFTFLSYDEVPWNNNNAENAIKRFVFLRKIIGGSSTENGIREYLILLSIRETMRRKNASFLQFLLSKQTVGQQIICP
jgi:predicted RecB family nuclease